MRVAEQQVGYWLCPPRTSPPGINQQSQGGACDLGHLIDLEIDDRQERQPIADAVEFVFSDIATCEVKTPNRIGPDSEGTFEMQQRSPLEAGQGCWIQVTICIMAAKAYECSLSRVADSPHSSHPRTGSRMPMPRACVKGSASSKHHHRSPRAREDGGRRHV